MVDKLKFAEEEGYRLTIFGKSVLVTEAMKNYIAEKLSKIERFQTHIMDIHVTMDIQKIEHSVSILLKFEHFKIKVQAVSTDMYASIDKAVDRLQTQLRRWKGRIQEHHQKGLPVIDMLVNVIRRPYDELEEFNQEIEQGEKGVVEAFVPHKIMKTKTLPLKTLTSEEAIMKMELSGDHFLIFRGEEDHKLKVIYRRSDGDYGIILSE